MKDARNFLPNQYDGDELLSVKHSYLREQFADYREIFEDVAQIVQAGDYTLGRTVDVLEKELAEYLQVSEVVSVGSGTDAIYLSLRALGVSADDEVILPSYTFYATAGAVVKTGASPVFCDVGSDGNVRAEDIQKALERSPRCRAIVAVHWTGRPVDISAIERFALEFSIPVVYDACHAIGAYRHGTSVASAGIASAFSFHPLKNLNVWGDGGFVATDDSVFADKIRLLRNHGLIDRNTCAEFGVNSRLDTIQAVVARHLLKKLPAITEARIKNATYLDSRLAEISEIEIPERYSYLKEVFHLYSFMASSRDALINHLRADGIDAKMHYPIPLHRQPAAARYLKQELSYPNSDRLSATTVSLPVHEFVTERDLVHMVKSVKNFYGKN